MLKDPKPGDRVIVRTLTGEVLGGSFCYQRMGRNCRPEAYSIRLDREVERAERGERCAYEGTLLDPERCFPEVC